VILYLINALIHRLKTYFKITNYDRAKYNRDLLERGQITPPPGLDVNRAAWLADTEKVPHTYRLNQQGDIFRVVHEDIAKRTDRSEFETGSRIAELLTRRHYLMVASDHQSSLKTIMLGPDKEVSIPIHKADCDQYGLFAEFVFFAIPADLPEEAQQALNNFCSNHKVDKIEKKFVPNGNDSSMKDADK